MSTTSNRSSSSLSVRFATVMTLCIAGTAGIGWADTAKAGVPSPKDTAYPGTIRIAVDASDTAQGIFRVHEVVPVHGRELTLLYPQWIPGNHSPTGPMAM